MPQEATHPNHVWTYDFVFDTASDSPTLRFLTLVDEFTRECLAIRVERRLPAKMAQVENQRAVRPVDLFWGAAGKLPHWALDIREGRFTSSPELHFIPGSLIRLDPETQVLVTKHQAVAALGAGLAWGDSAIPVVLRWFVEDGLYKDVVLPAPRAAKYFRSDLAALDMLRRGVLAV